VLRVRKGPAFGKSNDHDLYFLLADKAYLREVKTGLSGNEYLEIVNGAEIGDEIIISDISSLRKLKEIEIN
jgi:hypothetical protein